jgi:hypothetical protein
MLNLLRLLPLLLSIAFLAIMAAGSSMPVHASIAASTDAATRAQPQSSETGVAGAAPSATDSAAVQGAVNCDAAVSAIDSLQILRSVAGLGTSAACLAESGDVNCDAAVNSTDALRILQYIAGLSNTTPPGCTPIGEAIGGGPSSFDLIDKALKDGTIGSETALVYKVYAAFGDARLPAEYEGDNSRVLDTDAISEATAAWDTLSPQAQQSIAAYLIPPIYEGSWASQPAAAVSSQSGLAADPAPDPQGCLGRGVPSNVSEGWSYKNTEHFRVWYKLAENEVYAGYIAAEIENIWQKETSLMGQTPLSDGSEPCNAQGPALDIYVGRFGYGSMFYQPRALTVAYREADCRLRPAYILVQPSTVDTPSKAREAMAHEFFHTIELGAYDFLSDCYEYAWLGEATATWMMDYVYPGDDYEHEFDGYLLKGSFKTPLEQTWDTTLGQNMNGYEDWLFLFYLAHQTSPTAVRDIWAYTEVFDSLAAIDAGAPGGLIERWPEFALYNWNRPDIDYYNDWEEHGLPWKLPEASANIWGPEYRFDVSLGGANQRDFTMSDSVPLHHLSSRYIYATVDDDAVRRLVFYNEGFGEGEQSDMGRGKIQAWIKLADGSTRTEDWTGKDKITFCREKPSEKVTELFVVWSDSNYLDRSHTTYLKPNSKIRAESSACSFESHISSTYMCHCYNGPDVATGTTDATVNFERSPYQNEPGKVIYVPVSGTVNWTWHYEVPGDPGCSDSASGSYSLVVETPVTSNDSYEGWLWVWDDGTPGLRYSGGAVHQPDFTVPECGYDSSPSGINLWWHAGEELGLRTDADGVIRGSHLYSSEGGLIQQLYEWEIYPQ